jgi:hypothetical protein
LADTDSLVSVRNLTEGFGTPLRRFKGKFHSYATRPENQWKKTPVDLNFQDVVVVESTEPYSFPTATISINLSKTKKSMWGVFGSSLAKFLKEGEDIKDAQGKMMELALTPGHDFGKNQRGEVIIVDCWEVIALEGSGVKVDPVARALELLDGKTIPEFNQKAFGDPIIRGSSVASSLLDNTFIPAQEAAGKIIKDKEGVYHLSG